MRYASTRSMDISNGEGIGIAIFTQGCRGGSSGVRCHNCFNTTAWDFNGGKEWTENVKKQFIELANKDYILRLSILGGEPLEPENFDDLLELITEFKQLYPNKTIWLYTGYTWDEIFGYNPSIYTDITKYNDMAIRKQIISLCDILVDGRYVDELRDVSLKWRGSSNQRVIDIQNSLKQGQVTLYEQ